MPTPRLLLFVLSFCVLASALSAQAELHSVNGGTGADGDFNPTTNVTLDTNVQVAFNYRSMNIPAGVTVSVVGPFPAVILVCGDAVIDGTLDASGQMGGTGGNNTPGGLGGAGGPGAGAGGDGSEALGNNPLTGDGLPGTGPNPGMGGMDGGIVTGVFADPVGGGGGGGNATAGMPGGPPNSGSTIMGFQGAGGGAAMPPCIMGSGGGGGAADIDSTTTLTSNDGGGGGGGGGGNLQLLVRGSLTVNGAILANGGDGGTSSGNGGGGGGGSGGALEIHSPMLVNTGTISAVGGAGGAATQANCGCSPGGQGGDGCVTLVVCDPGATYGNVMPMPTVVGIQSMGPAPLTAACPKVTFGVCGSTGDNYTLVLAGALGAPLAVPGFTYTFDLDFNDFLFTATFPVNTLSPLVGGLTGNVPGIATVDLSPIFIPPGTMTTLYLQGVTSSGGTVTGITNVGTVQIAF